MVTTPVTSEVHFLNSLFEFGEVVVDSPFAMWSLRTPNIMEYNAGEFNAWGLHWRACVKEGSTICGLAGWRLLHHAFAALGGL